MNRAQILKIARKVTTNDREEQYGDCYTNHSNAALLISAYLEAKYGTRIPCVTHIPSNSNFALTAEDAAWIAVLQKMVRTFSSSPHTDNYIDAAAYAAIAGECRFEEESFK